MSQWSLVLLSPPLLVLDVEVSVNHAVSICAKLG